MRRTNRIDLHVHSNASDGAFSVEKILELSAEKRLKAISITDHDCIDSVARAVQLGSLINLEVIPGLELSCIHKKTDIHILGYFVDIENKALLGKLGSLRKTRYTRAEKIVENLNKMNIDLRFETVLEIAAGASIGRPHIALAMIKEELVYSIKDAFDNYIGYESPAYVEKEPLSPSEACRLIHESGGIAILAHPITVDKDNMIDELLECGVDGLEVFFPEQNRMHSRKYYNICRTKGLPFTGGSDFHDERFGNTSLGSLNINYSIIENLKEYLKKRGVYAAK
ncbi:MAG: PHP domain-containing protein [Fibrobacterota bacterium]